MKFEHLAAIQAAVMACVAAACLGVGAARAASFDCAKAGTFVEKAICADATLSRLDEVLAQNFRGMLAADLGRPASALRAEQRRWLAERDRCTDNACLLKRYRQRVDETCDYGVVRGVHPVCSMADDVAPPGAAGTPKERVQAPAPLPAPPTRAAAKGDAARKACEQTPEFKLHTLAQGIHVNQLAAKLSEDTIAEEKEIGRISGVVNQRRLHEAGRIIQESRFFIGSLMPEYKAMGGDEKSIARLAERNPCGA